MFFASDMSCHTLNLSHYVLYLYHIWVIHVSDIVSGTWSVVQLKNQSRILLVQCSLLSVMPWSLVKVNQWWYHSDVIIDCYFEIRHGMIRFCVFQWLLCRNVDNYLRCFFGHFCTNVFPLWSCSDLLHDTVEWLWYCFS